MALEYINKENFLAVMKEEQVNEFSIKIGMKYNDYVLRPADQNGPFDSNLRFDLYYDISTKDLEELLEFLNYDPNNKLGGFFKIDKNLANIDRRAHLYAKEMNT